MPGRIVAGLCLAKVFRVSLRLLSCGVKHRYFNALVTIALQCEISKARETKSKETDV